MKGRGGTGGKQIERERDWGGQRKKEKIDCCEVKKGREKPKIISLPPFWDQHLKSIQKLHVIHSK